MGAFGRVPSGAFDMLTIKMDKAPLEYLENELDKFGKHTMPYAIRDTLNTMAYETSRVAKKNADRLFVMRNTFTARSIQFERAKSLDMRRMESAAGSLQTYMREQEEGFTRCKSGKHGVPVPTSYAAGQQGARPRTKPVRRANWMARLKVARARRRAQTRGQDIVLAVQTAVATGQRVVFLPLRHPGLYRVLGGRRTERGWPKGAKLKMLYSLEDSTITTEPRRWLEPAAKLVISKREEYYRKAVLRQIEINRQFRGKR